MAFGIGITLLLALAILRADLVTDWRASLPRRRAELFLRRTSRPRSARSLRRRSRRRVRVCRACCRWCAGGWWRSTASRSSRGSCRATRASARLCRARAEPDLDRPSSAMTIASSRAAGGRRPIRQAAGVAGARNISRSTGPQARRPAAIRYRGRELDRHRRELSQRPVGQLPAQLLRGVPAGAARWGGGHLLTSAYLAPTSSAMAELVHRFPSVSIFNIGDLLAQARAVIDKAVTAVQSVFLFTLLAGLTVLLAQVQASREERRQEIAILRVLGAQPLDGDRQRAGGVRAARRARRRARLERRGRRRRVARAHAGSALPIRCAHLGAGRRSGRRCSRPLPAYVATRPIVQAPPHSVLQ